MPGELVPKKHVGNFWPMFKKTVLCRVDFNVPIANGEIQSDYRVRSALPTIRSIIDQGGICILMSHMGRPHGVAYSKLHSDHEHRERILQEWIAEAGTGKTAFFSVLTPKVKEGILAISSAAEKAKELKSGSGGPHSATKIFSQLSEEEKTRLLEEHTDTHKRGEAQFKHLRQYGGFKEQLSLRPVATLLSELLGKKVHFAVDCLDADDIVSKLGPGDVLLLENVRFYSDEASKDPKIRQHMAERLASYGDYFVSDAFGTAHRDSASMTGIARVMGHGAAGHLMAREVNAFSAALKNPRRPMCAIVGGAKVSDKILLLENMLERIDTLIIGGAMAYTFLKAQGISVGKSFCEAGQSFMDRYGKTKDLGQLANTLLELAKTKNVRVLLPVDHVCHTACEFTEHPHVTPGQDIPDGLMALDIGPKTVQAYTKAIGECMTAIWNGPMGVFEIDCYSVGTFAIAHELAKGTRERDILSIVGGGDSASAAEKSGCASEITHISTGGGASLELLEGKVLPGLDVLTDANPN